MFSLPTILILLLVSLIPLKLYQEFSSPLRNVPGPFLARFTRLWELFALSTGRFEQINIELHERYGPIVRLGPNRYSLSSPASSKKIYGHGSKFVKSSYYDAWGGSDIRHESNIFSVKDPAQHAGFRRRIAPLYTMSVLVGYEAAIDQCTRILSTRFEELANQGTRVAMREWLQFYAYDVIGAITVGGPFGILEAGKDSGILHAIDKHLVYSSRVGLLPEWHQVFGRLAGRFRPLERVLQEVRGLIEARAKAQAESKDGEKIDFMTKLIGLMQEGRIEEKDLNNAIGGNIGAGSDTTAISLSAVVLELSRNPECARKLREEIDELASEGKLSDPITFKEAQQMPYLQAVIKEALRVHPAVGQTLGRCVPAEGAELDGQFFPGGTDVGINPWVIHRDEEIFGADAHSFRPDRWLESKEAATRMDQMSLAFGAGSRTCIGKNISLLEMNKVLPQLFRTFEFELTQVAPHRNDWFVKQNFECRIKLRGGQNVQEACDSVGR